MSPVKKTFGVLGALVILAFFAYALSGFQVPAPHGNVPVTSGGIILPPPFTGAVKAQLAASHGFQVLVSYTGRGFEPAIAKIKKGQTVRFTNNTVNDLWVASAGTAGGNVYPAGSGNECGQSAFDSCAVIAPGAFWEFTFTQQGTWGYQNNRDTKMAGIVRVQ